LQSNLARHFSRQKLRSFFPATGDCQSGIAKGFAVDRAVKALRRAGVSSVNAGGDLRVFGSSSA
jgi:Membrane-associated lipoprotein involved in thiamine biosynthesis